MKLVLLDRDGVLLEERPGYVKSLEEIVIIPRALEALALLKQKGFTCVLVTNQSVVGRGIISQATLNRIHDFLCETVEVHGGKIDSLYFCTDHPDQATYRRKPKPGMLIEALEKYGAAAEETAFIGDTISDMMAAHEAGCKRYMVKTGKGQQEIGALPNDLQPVIICEDILDAAHKIING